MGDEVRFVRLKPYDEKSGFVVRDFTQRYGGRFVRFREPGQWYEVPPGLADLLAKARQIPQRPSSPPVFDVCTEREARTIDKMAEYVREEAKAVEEPSVDTARRIEEETGRGDLSLADVTAGRQAALADASARAAGDETPSGTPDSSTTSAARPAHKSGRSRKRRKS